MSSTETNEFGSADRDTQFGLDPERSRRSRLSFVVIGSGQVVSKYLLPSYNEGHINITDIVSLEPATSFTNRTSDFTGNYHQTTSAEDTFTVLTQIAQTAQTDLNIANVATSDVRLDLTRRILSEPSFGNARIFIEKPYAATPFELDAFEQLVEKYSDRLHFSGKYANGRADILFPHLPEGKAPKKITARLIEGRDYYRMVKDRLEMHGDHPYLHDGPELDLGFHLLDIISSAAARFGGIEGYRIKKAYDLTDERPDFEPHFGFGAELELKTKTGEIIAIDIQAGKVDGENERSIEFSYEDGITIGQTYTVGEATDPVYRKERRIGLEIMTELDRHSEGYNYYSAELQPDTFGHQTKNQQSQSILSTRVAFAIKTKRMEKR